MGVIAPRFGPAWVEGEHLTPLALGGRLEGVAGNLLRNANFRAAHRVSADAATFAHWTGTGNADASTPRRLVLDAGEYAEQEVHGLLSGGPGGTPVLAAAVVAMTSGARVRVSIAWTTGQTDTLEAGQAELPAAVAQVWGFTLLPGDATKATVRVENIGTGGTVTVHHVALGWGRKTRGPLMQREGSAAGGIGWGGVWNGSAQLWKAGARVLRIEDVRISCTAGNTSDAATVDLSTVLPAGAFSAADTVLAFCTMDAATDAGLKIRVARIAGTLSGSTLTVTAYAANALTFTTATAIASVLLIILPAAANVGSRGASKRAYPYG